MRILAAFLLVLSSCTLDGSGTGPGPDPGPADAVVGRDLRGAPTGDGGISEEPQALSGSRLKQEVLIGEDGSRQFAGTWRDSARGGERCAFAQAEDGRRRCLPTQGAASGGGLFADAACADPLFFTIAGCSPKYGFVATSACSGEAALVIYQITGAFTGMAYQKQGAGCVAAGAQNAYRGSRIPPAAFVAADLKTE